MSGNIHHPGSEYFAGALAREPRLMRVRSCVSIATRALWKTKKHMRQDSAQRIVSNLTLASGQKPGQGCVEARPHNRNPTPSGPQQISMVVGVWRKREGLGLYTDVRREARLKFHGRKAWAHLSSLHFQVCPGAGNQRLSPQEWDIAPSFRARTTAQQARSLRRGFHTPATGCSTRPGSIPSTPRVRTSQMK